MDLIKKEDAIKAEADRVYKALHSEGCKETYEECLADAEKTFKDVPSFEPKYEITADQLAQLLREGWTISGEPKQGEWILECDAEGEDDNLYRCSECGCNYGCQEYDIPNYCPDCGARMKGADNEQGRSIEVLGVQI